MVAAFSRVIPKWTPVFDEITRHENTSGRLHGP
jgi:hypothetical protein